MSEKEVKIYVVEVQGPRGRIFTNEVGRLRHAFPARHPSRFKFPENMFLAGLLVNFELSPEVQQIGESLEAFLNSRMMEVVFILNGKRHAVVSAPPEFSDLEATLADYLRVFIEGVKNTLSTKEKVSAS